ncbi:unnamed protein product [Effrenium voratum]|nr:unnamed protein product [Effrenium voratum]
MLMAGIRLGCKHGHFMLLFLCIPRTPVAIGVVLPGASQGCWAGGYTYQRCCVGRERDCFPSEFGNRFDETTCCSAMVEAMGALEELGLPLASRAPSPAIGRCVEESFSHAEESLARNSFLSTLRCIASLQSVDVVLDAFLGGGFSLAAVAQGLDVPKSRRRPPSVFSFEKHKYLVDEALAPAGPVGDAWPTTVANLTVPDTEPSSNLVTLKEQLHSYQLSVIQAKSRAVHEDQRPEILIGHGLPYNLASLSGYQWNALDILCQHHAPVDLVVMDAEAALSQEWLIIETICMPRLVALFGVNIHGASSWIKNRLEMLNTWQLEAKGVVKLGSKPWKAMAEVRRLRAWALFSNLAADPP